MQLILILKPSELTLRSKAFVKVLCSIVSYTVSEKQSGLRKTAVLNNVTAQLPVC